MSEPERRDPASAASALTVEGDVYLDGLRAERRHGSPSAGATLGSLTARRRAARQSRRVRAAPQPGRRQRPGPAGRRLHLHRARRAEPGHHRGHGCSSPAARSTAPSLRRQARHGHAIEAISATVRGGIDLGWRAVSPSVDFTDATTTSLADDPATWPERFTIAGLTYDRFEKPQGAAARPVWDQAAQMRLAEPPGRLRLRPLRAGGQGVPAARIHAGRPSRS